MPSERVQRVIDGYLDEIEVATKDGRWNDVSELANTILELDESNEDAKTFAELAASRQSPSTDQLSSEENSDLESEYEGSESSETSDAPDSLGGWLILVGLGFVWGIVFGAWNTVEIISMATGPGLSPFGVMLLLVESLLLIGYLWVGYFFLNKKRQFQKAFPTLLAPPKIGDTWPLEE